MLLVVYISMPTRTSVLRFGMSAYRLFSPNIIIITSGSAVSYASDNSRSNFTRAVLRAYHSMRDKRKLALTPNRNCLKRHKLSIIHDEDDDDNRDAVELRSLDESRVPRANQHDTNLRGAAGEPGVPADGSRHIEPSIAVHTPVGYTRYTVSQTTQCCMLNIQLARPQVL